MDTAPPCPAPERDRPEAAKGRVTLAKFREEIVGIQMRELAKSSAVRTDGEMRKLQDLGVVWVDEITRDVLSRWRQAELIRGVRGTTIKGYYSAIRSAIHYAIACGYMDRDPTLAMPMRFSSKKLDKKRCLTPDETARLFGLLREEADHGWEQHRLFAIAVTIFGVGLRVTEGLRLKVADVDVARGLIDLRNRSLKTEASSTFVAMPNFVAHVLARWICDCRSEWLFPHKFLDGPWVTGGPGKTPREKLQAVAKRAGVDHVTLAMGRHGWATMARTIWGLNTGQVQVHLRHTIGETQEHYVHADGVAMRPLVATIQFPGLEPRSREGSDCGQKAGTRRA